MDPFGDIVDAQVQEKKLRVHVVGNFKDSKTLFVQPNWTKDDLLCAASKRVDLVPTAKYIYNADGLAVEDIICLEDNEMIFISNAEQNFDSNDDKGEVGSIGGYRLGKVLGRGGFGEVRIGIHQLTGEQVALKFIPKGEIGDLGDAERTITEIQCLVALQHPNIIKLLRVLNDKHHVVLVFELLKGGDMNSYLLRTTDCKVSEDDARNIFKQILAGVSYAHNHHICHRDLKLENLLLSESGTLDLKIADFGLSDFYRPGDVMKTNCGTISYLSPEVFRGTANAGPPLDVWSMGVILFAILCGRMPFEDGTLRERAKVRESEVRARILSGEFYLDPDLSPEAKDLAHRMLNTNAEQRITIAEIFTHKWLRGRRCSIEEDLLSESVHNEIANIRAQDRAERGEQEGVDVPSGTGKKHDLPSALQIPDALDDIQAQPLSPSIHGGHSPKEGEIRSRTDTDTSGQAHTSAPSPSRIRKSLAHAGHALISSGALGKEAASEGEKEKGGRSPHGRRFTTRIHSQSQSDSHFAGLAHPHGGRRSFAAPSPASSPKSPGHHGGTGSVGTGEKHMRRSVSMLVGNVSQALTEHKKKQLPHAKSLSNVPGSSLASDGEEPVLSSPKQDSLRNPALDGASSQLDPPEVILLSLPPPVEIKTMGEKEIVETAMT